MLDVVFSCFVADDVMYCCVELGQLLHYYKLFASSVFWQ